DQQVEAREGRRGREARKSARAQRGAQSVPYITRNIPLYELLTPEGLDTIIDNAENLMQEVGLEFRDYPRALELFKAAGADIKGERVRF
ncbi:trimethylamine methyltransferase family protein, partial [Escherichia coli]